MGVVVLLLLVAQTPTAAELSVAREQFNAGVAAAKENRWEDAHRAFERAYALTKKPSILFNLAGAQQKTLRLVEARETYRKFIGEAGDDQRQAKAEAQRLLAGLEPKIPRVVISLEAETPADLVTLDGRELPRAVLGVELPINPGKHRIARGRGGVEISGVDLEIAEAQRLPIVLAGPPPIVEAPPPPPPPPIAPPITVVEHEEDDDSFFSGPWFWVILGAVVVVGGGVATGVVLGNRDPEAYGGTTGVTLQGLDP